LPLQLNFVSKLRDQSETDVYSKIEILQAKTLKEFYFVGVYSQKGDYRAQMDQLKIVRKKDNSVFQTLDFSKQENLVGNVMTIRDVKRIKYQIKHKFYKTILRTR
jgi:uncharacterized NAD(P)/FAD-binding protein YdhS